MSGARAHCAVHETFQQECDACVVVAGQALLKERLAALDKDRERAWKERRLAEERARLAREEAARAKLEAEVSRGSPGRASVSAVVKDARYEQVADTDGGTWPSTMQHVVRHREKQTLWSCRYAIRTDDSDAGCSQNWEEVEAVQVTVTCYEAKRN